jgi:arylsulfatase A-like enzyme
MLCSMMPRLEMDPWESLEGNLPLTCLPHLLAELGYQTAYLQSAQGAFENRPGLIRNLGFSFSAYRETLERPGFERLGYFGLDDRAMAAPALSWIDGHRETPWLMVLLTSSTHHPYQTPGVSLARAQADPRSAYARAVALQDELLGGLLAGLADRGELERTVVLVIGDHGEAFGQHGLNHHDMVPYEEVTRVPWLLDGPEELIGPPRRIGGLRHHFDLLPTVLGVLGVDWSGRVLGTDLLHGPGHDRVVSSCWFENGCLGMRRGDLKLVHHFGSRPLEVFDLAADPGERVDLARTLDASLLRELESSLFGFQLSVDRFWGRQPLGRGRKLWWAEGTRLGERPLQP